MAASKAKLRPCTESFDDELMESKLTQVVASKDKHAFCWLGTTYIKGRYHAPDPVALAVHAPVLEVFFAVCPSGFFAPKQMANLFVRLHAKFKLLDTDNIALANLQLDDRAAKVSDNWRIMALHCLKVKADQRAAAPALHSVLALIGPAKYKHHAVLASPSPAHELAPTD